VTVGVGRTVGTCADALIQQAKNINAHKRVKIHAWPLRVRLIAAWLGHREERDKLSEDSFMDSHHPADTRLRQVSLVS
jgi:hypothetical protein